MLSKFTVFVSPKKSQRDNFFLMTRPADAFRIQSHLMFFDTSHNSRRTMLENLYLAFVETATKMWAYARCLPGEKQPSPRLLIGEQQQT